MASWLVNALGFAAFATNVAGNFLLAHKRLSGWVVRLVSIVLWGVYASEIASWPMIANAITFFGINCYGIWQWRKAGVNA